MLKRGLDILISLLFVSFASAQRFFDYGYEYGSGFGGPGGYGFISNLCNNYGDIFEFFILFIVFFVLSHWAFKGRSKSDLLSAAVAFALSFAMVRWGSTRGFSLVCGLGDSLGGLFGGFVGLAFLLIIILAFFALSKGGDGSKAGVGIAYILFYFWLGSEGGFYFSDLFYYLPLDPFFIDAILNILLLVAVGFVLIFGYRWFQNK